MNVISEMIPAGLSDPDICGEDLADAARRVLQLAPVHCEGCADYHLIRVLKRHASGSRGSLDRSEMAAIVSRLVGDSLKRDAGPAEIVLAGTGDTGLLGTCAHGAILATSETDRLHFTVIDRCETPLALCRDYGKRNGLAIDTIEADLLDAAAPRPADIVALHSLLSFIPADRHEEALRHFSSWLKPGGRIVFSTDIVEQPASTRSSRRQRQIQEIRSRLAEEESVDASALAWLEERLEAYDVARTTHVHDFASIAEVDGLIGRAGLKCLERREVPADKPTGNDRLVCVLTP